MVICVCACVHACMCKILTCSTLLLQLTEFILYIVFKMSALECRSNSSYCLAKLPEPKQREEMDKSVEEGKEEGRGIRE